MKVATPTSTLRKHRSRRLLPLVAGVVAAAVALGVCAGTAGATSWKNFDLGTGECLLRDMGSFGSGGNSTITAPGINLKNTGSYWVTVHKWTIIIDAVTGARVAEYYVGAVNAAPNGVVSFAADTRDIPARSVSNYHMVRIQDVVAVYPYGTNILEEVDTFTASSYSIWKNGAYFNSQTNIVQTAC